MTSKDNDAQNQNGRDNRRLKPLELFETIATEIEKKRRAAARRAAIPAEWRARVEARVAQEIAGWENERSAATGLDKASPVAGLAQQLTIYIARFDAAFAARMGGLFPGVAAPALAGTRYRSGTPARTEDGLPVRDEPEIESLTPEQREKELAALPDWIVVAHGGSMFPGREFAILWTRDGPAPTLPALEIRLDGAPVAEDVAWSYPITGLEGLPGETTLVSFAGIKPAGCRIEAGEDGRLILDFTTA